MDIGQKEEILFGPQGLVIDKIKKLRAERMALGKEFQDWKATHDAKLATIEAELRLMENECTHYDFDGKSAFEGGFMFTTCRICGYNY